MVIYYVHPLTTLCIVLVVVSLIAGLIASLNGFAEMIVNPDEETESLKMSGKVAGWCLLFIMIGAVTMYTLNYNQDRPLSRLTRILALTVQWLLSNPSRNTTYITRLTTTLIPMVRTDKSLNLSKT